MRLFSTDIDGTVFDGPESAELFNRFWSTLRRGSDGPLLVYNTGRSLEDARSLIGEVGLPVPDFFICSVGTEIFHWQESRLIDDWNDELSADWHFDEVFSWVEKNSPARPQPDENQNAYKCSWFWEDADVELIHRMTQDLGKQGIRAQAVYSSNRDLDFLPEKANKGNALAWLANQLELPNTDLVVAGDSGNDASMYRLEDVRGVLVANAERALVEAVREFGPYHANEECAAGVVEGLCHFLDIPISIQRSERKTA